jgi:dipeptidyl aminopeptidase/acylaminoacyl peptidase
VATQAQTLVDSRPDTAMLLGVQAYRTAPTVEARSALIGLSTRGAYQSEFIAHSGPVSDLAFTADGRALVTVSRDRSIAVWDTRDHHRIASLTGHDTWLRAVAITADGSTMASGGDDRDIVLWDLASHVRIATLAAHTGAVKDVAFSPDGRLLASGGADDTVIVWDLAHRTAIARLTGHGGTVNSVAFSPDGRLLAAAGTGHAIVLWDVATHTRVRTLVGHTDVVNQVAFDASGRYLASAGDTTVRLWNVVDGSPRKVLTGHTDRVKRSRSARTAPPLPAPDTTGQSCCGMSAAACCALASPDTQPAFTRSRSAPTRPWPQPENAVRSSSGTLNGAHLPSPTRTASTISRSARTVAPWPSRPTTAQRCGMRGPAPDATSSPAGRP